MIPLCKVGKKGRPLALNRHKNGAAHEKVQYGKCYKKEKSNQNRMKISEWIITKGNS